MWFHGINASKEIVEDIIRDPDRTDIGYKKRLIAQKGFDDTRVLRVVYEAQSNEEARHELERKNNGRSSCVSWKSLHQRDAYYGLGYSGQLSRRCERKRNFDKLSIAKL
jgi:hypothetical protein